MNDIDVSIKKAKPEKLFYFVVTGVIYRSNDKRCLILQRSKKEIAHPGLWGAIGGKLEWSQLLNEARLPRSVRLRRGCYWDFRRQIFYPVVSSAVLRGVPTKLARRVHL
jgi:hypothetical protein